MFYANRRSVRNLYNVSFFGSGIVAFFLSLIIFLSLLRFSRTSQALSQYKYFIWFLLLYLTFRFPAYDKNLILVI